MKKYIFSAFICTLLAMVGCQKSETEIADVQQSGKEVVVTANIKGSTSTRVTMTDQGPSGVKVAWKGGGETFQVTNDNGSSSSFTQIGGTNQFTGTLPEGEELTGFYNWIYEYNSETGEGEGVFDLSEQDGTLNDDYVYMHALIDPAETPLTINFFHDTFILKPTFTIDATEVDNKTISEIVIGNLKVGYVKSSSGLTETIVNPSSQKDIYIFALESDDYNKDHVLTFEVTADGKEYSGTYTLTKTLQAGYLYTATVTLTEKAAAVPYVTFSAESEQIFKLSSSSLALEYSVNDGDWKTYDSEAHSNGVTFGDTHGNLRLRGNLTDGTKGTRITFTDITSYVTCSGDIRTLQAGENYTSAATCGNFKSLFNGCKALVSAEDLVLPAQTLVEECYESMFQNCTSLTTAPELPATTLANKCYRYMFRGCTSLTTAPALPAPTLAEYCYNQMFWGCTSLATAPDLPATNLASYCYQYMFFQCAKLTTVPNELPATVLAINCYNQMFYECSELTTAPVLPAQTLVENCYSGMFKSCSKLNSITMLATDISGSNCLNSWVEGVASTGTFIKAASMESLPEGASGIPSDWTEKNYSN